MSDTTIRRAERGAQTVEERSALLLARWRAGEWVERQIEVPCEGAGCEDGRVVSWTMSFAGSGTSWSKPCPTCNGSGVRTIPGRELAAYVGDDRARYLLGQCCPKHDAASLSDPPLNWGSACAENPLGAWVRGLERYGREACVRAAAAVYAEAFKRESAGFPHLERGGPDLGDELHRIVLAALDESPEPAVRQAIRDALVPWALGEVE